MEAICKYGSKDKPEFCLYPFNRLLEMIVYKAEVYGIQVILTEESYTSKCSFLDDEFPKKYTSYLGKRIKRGLFRSADGTLSLSTKYSNLGRININADVNAAYNIGMKVDSVSKLYSTLNDNAMTHLHPKIITMFG